MTIRAFLLIFLLVPSLGWAQQRSALEAVQKDLSRLENHSNRLESLLLQHSQRIIRLKAQNASVRREFQLKSAMRDSQELASKLTLLRSNIREMIQSLVKKYQKIINETKEPAARKQLAQNLRLLKLKLTNPKTRILTGGQISPFDSPEDLIEKADLLEDSEEKIQRKIRQVEIRIASLEHRVKLKRHGKALDDNPFNEASPRRTSQVRRATVTDTAKDDPTPVTPPPGAVNKDVTEDHGKSNMPAEEPATGYEPNSDYSATPAASDTRNTEASDPDLSPRDGSGSWTPIPEAPAGSGTEGVIVSIQDVMDPSLLMEITGPNKNNKNLLGHIAALKKAQQQLHNVAIRLNQQAKQLRKQANNLRQKK